MGVNAYHLAVLLNIGDNVVDGNFRSGAGGGRNCNYRNCRLLCGSNTLQASNISELRIVDDDSDRLGGIHGGTAADCDEVVSAALLESSNAGLNVFDGGVRLDIIINLVSQTVLLKHIEDLLGHTELDEVGIGTYESFLECAVLCFDSDVGDSACAMIGGFVEYKSVCHNCIFLSCWNLSERRNTCFSLYLRFFTWAFASSTRALSFSMTSAFCWISVLQVLS